MSIDLRPLFWPFIISLPFGLIAGLLTYNYLHHLAEGSGYIPPPAPPRRQRHWVLSFLRIYRAAKPRRPRFRTPTGSEKFVTIALLSGGLLAGASLTLAALRPNAPWQARLTALIFSFFILAFFYVTHLYFEDAPPKIRSMPPRDDDLSNVAKDLADEYRRK